MKKDTNPLDSEVLGRSAAAAAAKSLQSCLTLCNRIDGSPPGSPVPGILQARTLEWVTISFTNVWKWKMKVKSLSRVWLLATPWTAAYQALPSMGLSRQEYWSGVPRPSLLGRSSRCQPWAVDILAEERNMECVGKKWSWLTCDLLQKQATKQFHTFSFLVCVCVLTSPSS